MLPGFSLSKCHNFDAMARSPVSSRFSVYRPSGLCELNAATPCFVVDFLFFFGTSTKEDPEHVSTVRQSFSSNMDIKCRPPSSPMAL